MYPARSLTWDRQRETTGSRYPADPLSSEPFPHVTELRFAVPAVKRIPIYDDLIGDLEDRLREARERHDNGIREHLADLQGLRSEAQEQAAVR
jgi:hypothetical protein